MITKQFKVDALTVEIFDNRVNAGAKAARDIASAIHEVLKTKDNVNIILGSAPSQDDLYEGLLAQKDIPWEKINAFHMDEYIGLPSNAPQAFARYLLDRLYTKVPLHAIYLLDSEVTDVEAEMNRYTSLLQELPPDIVCIGIGENGHIAFNDPPADFHDSLFVKKIALDGQSRQQQVNDNMFATLADVPTHAMTLTIPALVNCAHLFCVVPAPTKAEAVRKTLEEAIGPNCPASIIREHKHATLYLDPDSATKLSK